MILIWGLKSVRHSHRFVHEGFYNAFKKLGHEVGWVDDENQNTAIPAGSILIVSGMASRNFPIRSDIKYVMHNVLPTSVQQSELNIKNPKTLKLQVHTNDANGEVFQNLPYVSFNADTSTLYQPWGVPVEMNQWISTVNPKPGCTEFWVGAIWNNSLNQGNTEIIRKYKKILKSRKIKFKRVGGSRWRIGGLTDTAATQKIYQSPLGTTILGDWQLSNQYVPCRLFKNIASGKPPITNGDFSKLLEEFSISSQNLEELVDTALSETLKSRQKRLLGSQKKIEAYTYTKSVTRIIDCLDSAKKYAEL